MVTSWENRAAPALSVYSSIAQSVERMTVNHDVAGSSPAWGARNRKPVDDVSTGFFVAGAVRIELTTRGFGDRCSTC